MSMPAPVKNEIDLVPDKFKPKDHSKEAKRKAIEAMVLTVVGDMDNSKHQNYDRYKAMFDIMSDAEFSAWASHMGTDLDATVQIYQLPFEEMRLTQIKKAADDLNIPLEEYIWYHDKGKDAIRTITKVPVGYIHIKRVQQMLAKKNKYSLQNEDVDFKSGQPTGSAKVAAISDAEAFCLNVINANEALKEFMGPRADNQAKKREMYSDIAKNGYVMLDNLKDDIDQHTTLNTMNVYLIASGIRSDLVTTGLKTRYTIDQDLKAPSK
jgi:hypothetical protein